MKNLLFLLLLTGRIHTIASSQENYRAPYPDLSVKVSPLALLDWGGGPCLRMSLEKHIRYGLSAQGEISLYVPETRFYSSVRGYRARGGIRYYFPVFHADSDDQQFIGLSVMTKQQSFGVNGSIYDTLTHNSASKKAFVDKKVYGISLSYGVIFPEKNNFYLELELGLGVRFRDANIYGLTPKELDAFSPVDPEEHLSVYVNVMDDSKIAPDAYISLKVCYRIK
jgi:hypothetical protein